MKRQAPASPSSNTPANLAYNPSHHSSGQPFSPEEAHTAAAAPFLPPHQHPQSAPSQSPTPYSAGIFGRQRAAKRQPLPDVKMSANSVDSPKVSPFATPAAHQGRASPLQDALDRFNARCGKRLSSASAPSEPAQQPLDALDRFNARNGFMKPQTSILQNAVVPSSGSGLHPAAQADPKRARTGPQCKATMQMQAPAPGERSSQSAGPQPARQQQQQHAQRGMDALDRFNRRKSSKVSSNYPSPQGADAVAQHKSRLHSQASQHVQQPLDGLLTALPHFDSHLCRLQSAGYQASEGLHGQDTCEDSQQSQTTSLESQRVSDLRGVRPAVSLAAGYTATHTPDALDRVNSILLARRKSRIGVSAAQVCRTSASPDATVSSAHAQTAGTKQPVDMSIDEVEQPACAQMWHDDAVPTGMYSSKPHLTAYRSSTADLMHTAKVADGAPGSARNVPQGKKHMRAFNDDYDDGNAAGAVAKKKFKAKAADAVAGLHGCHTTGKCARQGNVFNRLAQQSS